jgi:deoxyadenosine/deoxycytidine kinase
MNLITKSIAIHNIKRVYIWLDQPPETCIERIRQRGRDFEIKNYTLQYIQGLADSQETFFQQLQTHKYKITPEERSPKVVHAIIKNILQKEGISM